MAEPEYEIQVTRRLPNPSYVPERADPFGGGYHRDERTPDQRDQFLLVRVMTATLTDAEYECVKRALIEHWAQVE